MGRRRVAVDRDRRGEMDRLARRRRPATGGGRRICEDFAADVRRSRVQGCAAARHGRVEPRPRGVRRDVRRQARLSDAACARFDRSGADPPFREPNRPAAHTSSSCRASPAARSNPTSSSSISSSAPRPAVGAAEAAKRFVAITDPGSSLEKIARDEGFRARLPRPAQHRRALFGAVEFRHGAGRGDRRRRRAPFSKVRPRWCAPARRARRRSRTPG